MTIADFTHRETSAWVSGTASVLPTYPTDVSNGTTAADDIVYLTVAAKPDTTTITPSGSWTLVEENTGGSGAAGADTGATKIGIYKRSVPGGGLTSTTTVTLTGASVAVACISNYRPVTAGRTPVWTEDVVNASVTSASTSMAATASASSAITIADGVHVAVTCASPSDAATTQPVSTIVASGATIGTPAVAPGSDFSALGNDIGISRYDAEVTAGTSSAAPSITGTAAASTTRQVTWLVIRLDQTIPNTNAAAEHASGTGTAYDATVTTTGSASAPAGHASGTGSAGAPTVTTSALVAAGHASGTGAAGDPKPNVRPNAGAAAGTGAALTATDTTDSNVAAGHASGTGAALAATASTEDPVGVPFLLAQLDGAQLAVEAAFGADLAADDATWVWTDISDYVRYDGKINLRHGRRDEAAKVQPATCSVKLDNRSGAFSRGGQSQYWPYIRLNTPVRVSIDPGDGSGYQAEFFGFADSWQPGWDSNGVDATVELSASGILRRLAQGTAALISPFRRAMLARTDVVAYWPCEEPKRAQAIPSGLPGGTAMVISGTAEFPYPKFGESDAFPASQALPEVNQTSWRGTVPTYTATNAMQLRFFAAFPELLNGTECIIASLFTAGSLVRWDVTYVNAGNGALKVHVTDTTGTRTELTYTDFNCNNTARWYSLELIQDGTGVDWWIRTIGIGYSLAGAVTGTVTTDTVTRATAVAIAPDGDVPDLALGHITVQSAVSGFVADELDAFNAYDYELVTDRVARLCDEAGVPVTITGTSTVRMGPQPIGQLVPLLRECEVVDGGLLYDGLANGLSYVTGDERVNAAADLTLDASAGEVGNPEPVDDDQRIRNKVTAKREAGGEAVYEDTDGELGTTAIGVYDDSVEVNSAFPDDLIDHASRQVALGTLPGYRYPRLELALHANPDRVTDWLATTLSARVDVTDIDDVRTQHPAGTVSLLLEGYSQRIDQYLWDVTMNTSPYEPMRAGVYATATGTLDVDYVQRVDTDGSTLVSGVAAGATSLSVSTPSGPIWVRFSQVPDDFPFDIEVGGIRVTVTAVSGSSSPQTFTVTGSTVTKALTAGSTVALWRPVALGM